MAFGTELAVSFTEGIFGIKLVYYEYPSIQFPGSIMVYIIYNLVRPIVGVQGFGWGGAT